MALYSVEGTDITLVAGTAKTVLAAINSSAGVIKLVEWGVSFDGVSATAIPVLIELCSLNTTSAGTATAHTIAQVTGPTRTPQFTAKRAYTVEPTATQRLNAWRCHPQSGMVIQYPQGREPQQWVASYALVLRVTITAGQTAVNVTPYMLIEE